ncbi:MAG: phosphoglycolate phosphatase [Gammaproteobacteria bacterium]|nr:phosphoglycolate phosphatase [Gammaproteobacteria bacterium]
MRPPPEAVLFDLDGTLLDTAPDMVAALHALQDEESVPRLAYDSARAWVSHGVVGVVGAAFGALPETERARLQQRFIGIYATCLARETRPFPGMREVLAAIEAAGVPWGVVTNKVARLSEPILAACGLRSRCAVVVSGDTTAQRKPHPLPLLHALDAIGVAPAHAIYVGDAARDIAAGRAAGTHTVAALYGYIPADEEPAGWGAEHCIRMPMELLGVAGIPLPQAAVQP